MNVSATTIVANTAKIGSTTAERATNITNGKITTINVTGDTTITGDALVKTTIAGSTIDTINANASVINTRVLENKSNLDSLDLRHANNNDEFSNISGEYHLILQTEFPTTDKITDLSGKCKDNEDNILDVSNEVYLLETANEGSYPLDAEQTALEERNNRNISDSDILFIRVYGLKDDALDGDFADRSIADNIETRIGVNTQDITDASEGYYSVYNNVSTLATQENYDDLSQRANDVSDIIVPFISDTNIFGFNDISNREGDLSENIGYLGDLSDSYPTKFTLINNNIIDISNNISVTNERVTIGVSATEFTTDTSGVFIGEDTTRNNTYFNGKVTDIRGETTISGTADNIIQPNHMIDTDFLDISRDVSSITVDFTSNTPYAPTHYIILDPSEAIVGDPPFGTEQISNPSTLLFQSDGGTGLDLRISRLSRSRRIVVTVPPATASRVTVTLYDDDSFSSVTSGYGISDERRSVMESNMGAFHNLLTGNSLTGSNLYRIRDSIQVSPGCAPAIDISFLGYNSTQKSQIATQLLTDTSPPHPSGVPRLQYSYNPMNTSNEVYNGGSLYHIVRDVSEIQFNESPGISDGDYEYLQFVSTMNGTGAITNVRNVKLHGLPSFLFNQTIDRDSNGNRIDFIFGGASRFVHNTANNPPLTEEGEIASPFDYNGGNSYTFEINLVSTGRSEHKDLVKLYITEKTRQAPARRFYTNKFINNVLDIQDIPSGQEIVSRFGGYKFLRKKIYPQLTPNPPVI
jgi:hypothetical protein